MRLDASLESTHPNMHSRMFDAHYRQNAVSLHIRLCRRLDPSPANPVIT